MAYEKKSELDQFYTDPEIAKQCLNKLWALYLPSDFDIIVEPSAGSGSFLAIIPGVNKLGLDLDPKCQGIIKKDFFTFECPRGNILTVGNPPFGKNSNLAVAFFNKAATFSTVIAFIVPRTFEKQSLKNKLDLSFVLKTSFVLPKDSFLLSGQPYNVPCCFQIWVKSTKPRKIIKTDLTNPLFTFSTKGDCDFAVRRVGGRSGFATVDYSDSSETSNYFLKTIHGNNTAAIVDSINNVDFRSVTDSTAGVRSLSKPELVLALRSHNLI